MQRRRGPDRHNPPPPPGPSHGMPGHHYISSPSDSTGEVHHRQGRRPRRAQNPNSPSHHPSRPQPDTDLARYDHDHDQNHDPHAPGLACPGCAAIHRANETLTAGLLAAVHRWAKETSRRPPCDADAMEWQPEPTTLVETRGEERRMSEVYRRIAAATGRRVSFLVGAVGGGGGGGGEVMSDLDEEEERAGLSIT